MSATENPIKEALDLMADALQTPGPVHMLRCLQDIVCIGDMSGEPDHWAVVLARDCVRNAPRAGGDLPSSAKQKETTDEPV